MELALQEGATVSGAERSIGKEYSEARTKACLRSVCCWSGVSCELFLSEQVSVALP